MMKITVEFMVDDHFPEEWYEVLSAFAGLELDLPHELVPQVGDHLDFKVTTFVDPPDFWVDATEEDELQQYEIADQLLADQELAVVKRVFSGDRIRLYFHIDGVHPAAETD
ncbi:hypothetical protein [Siphonobacter sp. BAB-5385]|uniref:hypothetical protein n=1 Tax=Siphonobacter sp. BAB-5385 TaxID=1864822 RepID=UPI0011400659|nr:hypothetical protein [Siphonobacter sp. BAB-5385]